jgi:hypothetical protein
MLTGPETFFISYDPHDYSVVWAPVGKRFGGTALGRAYKLYVVSQDGWPVYVGVTKRPLVERFRLGWKAKGESGYYGYEWRKAGSIAQVDVWTLPEGVYQDAKQYLETIEAELVFHIREAGQWPSSQTEIHFHESTDVERAIAQNILARYTKATHNE